MLAAELQGALGEGWRWLDPQLIAHGQAFIESLYHDGEPLDVFFARAVAPLQPPRLTAR
ncbi:hypothetical protein [Micromonospora sp. WMMD975]|uniref:hypothetical protein n=1 Tax=Micromonospora sp. WMMD975 TaxID=3016087 RepID=UPI00249A492E|nr:hypothetical protein [Micromonospora sp. WMMD975]WFE35603.1 hypothetical protein O7613_09550 [Micromonospora sp. WMMD975]